MMLFTNCKNSKYKGNIGLTDAQAWFARRQYIISSPLNDSQDYDFIAEDLDGKLFKVQVKTTEYIRKKSYIVNLKVSGGSTFKRTIKTADNTKYDLLYILCDNSDRYLIPKTELKNTTALTLSKEFDKYKVTLDIQGE